MAFNSLKARATSRRQFTFYHEVPRNSWCSLYRPRKDERLNRPWSHRVVLNTGPLDWESSALTTWLFRTHDFSIAVITFPVLLYPQNFQDTPLLTYILFSKNVYVLTKMRHDLHRPEIM